jgi:DNA-binding MarR family transcriptional regulator
VPAVNSLAIKSRAIYMLAMRPSSHSDPAPPAAGDPLDRLLCFAVYSTGLAFNRVYKPLLDALGLTYTQYLAIISLAERDGQTVGELGERLFLESNTLTPLIKRLEAGGFVRRQRDSADERMVRVTLTEQGREVAEKAACLPERILAATGVSAEELAAVARQLIAIRGNLRESAT